MSQADGNGSDSKPGELPTTERNRKDGLQVPDADALAWLRERSPLETTYSALAREWCSDRMTTTRWLRRQEEQGLLTCSPSPGRRTVLIICGEQSEPLTTRTDEPLTEGREQVLNGADQSVSSSAHPAEQEPATPQEALVSTPEQGREHPADQVALLEPPKPRLGRGLNTLLTNREQPAGDGEQVRSLSVSRSEQGVSSTDHTIGVVVPFRRPSLPSNLAEAIDTRAEELRGLLDGAAETVQPDKPKARRLPLFRPSQGLRVVSAGAVAVSITMIAYHSAGSSAASVFHWWATLAMAIILSTGKVFAGSQAERSFADGDRLLGWSCVAAAVFLLCVDASLLYAFRGDSLSNAAAQEKAQMEQRERIKGKLDGLIAERQRLTTATGPAVATDVRLVAEVEADLRILESAGDCRMIQPRARKGHPTPAPVPTNPRRCETKRADLQAELARAEDAAKDEAKGEAAAEKREKRLAELPDLIAKAENELGAMQARATPDHGASIVARGLNWVPAGLFNIAPVEGRGVEIFWSWAFVLAAELFAVGGFAIAARADRRARGVARG